MEGISMINLNFNRRDFMKIGGIGAGFSAVGLSDLSASEDVCLLPNDKSVIWIWLSGGATQVETFDPKPDAPEGIRAVNGSVMTKGDYLIGGDWVKTAGVGDKMTVVRSFSHGNSSHRTATHWVMTGYNSTDNTPQSPAYHPSYGSMVSSMYGANNPINGSPTYVRANRINFDEGAWLRGNVKPYEASGEGVKNLQLNTTQERFLGKQELLTDLDVLREGVDKGADSWSDLRGQSYSMLLGKVAEAFDIKKEHPATLSTYGKGIGEQLLLARRLVEAGTKFVTINYGGWDMHGNISQALRGRVPPLDQALSALISDIYGRNINKDTLVVVTGEFGRTYKINKNAGRDHWSKLSPLLLAGGDFEMGRVIGESTSKAEEPKTQLITPQNVTATLFKHFNIDQHTQKIDPAGRPRYFLETGTESIL